MLDLHLIAEIIRDDILEYLRDAKVLSVMLDVNDSVATRLRENGPYVMTVHCVAHRLELGATLNTIHEI